MQPPPSPASPPGEAERYQTLLEINNAIISHLTPGPLFHAVAQALRRVLPIGRSAIFLHDPEKDVLRLFMLESSLPSQYFHVGLEMPPGDSHVGWVFQHQKPLLRRDLERERQYSLEDRALADGVRSYVIVPLIARTKTVGTLAVASTTPNQYDETDAAFLQEAANQVALAVENMHAYKSLEHEVGLRRQAEEMLRSIMEGTAAVTGADFFPSLVRHLAAALRVRFAFVTESVDGANTRVRSLAFWKGERFGDSFEYEVAGTPCHQVLEGKVAFYPRDVQRLFPRDRDLVELGAESYLGIPIFGATGQVIGHLAILHDKPMEQDDRGVAILRIFAARAGAELERLRASDEVQRLNLEQEVLLGINRAIGRHLDRDQLFGALSACLRTVVPTEFFGIELPIEGDKLQGHLLATQYTDTGAERTQPTVLPAAGTACNWVMQNRELLITASRDESRQRFPVTFDVMAGRGMESLCALPLVSGNRCRGALFFMAAAKSAYQDLDRGFLEQVASAVAVALDDCLAHEEVRQLRDRLAVENIYLQEEIRKEHDFVEMVGSSPALLMLLRKVEQAAPTDTTVLISGETGTGKELIARAIHSRSARKDRPLVKVDCSAISAGLVESELFGHVKGAFTGAIERRTGRFEVADGGTIFLDEVGELPPETQAKLLRVLQEQQFEPVGSNRTVRVDVRVIAATNRDLEEAVRAGRFRSDLFFRLNVFPLQVPPLRDRRSDIRPLVMFFLSRFAKRFGKGVDAVSRETMDRLVNYAWPGNVRELQNIIERAVILSQGPVLELGQDLLPAPAATIAATEGVTISGETLGPAVPKPSGLPTLEEIERNHILAALQETGGIIEGSKGAAKILNLHPNTLRSRMEKLGIKRSRHGIS
jgi:formate hydrogenlyase transcriptional activator